MSGNLEVIAALKSALAAEAHLNIQYRHDWRIVKFMGVKKVAGKVHSFGSDAHEYMRRVADRVLFLGGDTNYTVGAVTDQSTLTAVFQNELKLEMALVQPYEQAVQTAMQALDDTSRNLFEHLLKWHQKHAGWLEQQLRLIAMPGGEADYIREKL
jgi:bacterioferritin